MKTINDIIQASEERFEKEFPCEEIGCEKGKISGLDADGDIQFQPCRICFCQREPIKSFLLSSQTQAFNLGYKEGLEKAKSLVPKEKDVGWQTITEKDVEIKIGERNFNGCREQILESLESELKNK